MTVGGAPRPRYPDPWQLGEAYMPVQSPPAQLVEQVAPIACEKRQSPPAQLNVQVAPVEQSISQPPPRHE